MLTGLIDTKTIYDLFVWSGVVNHYRPSEAVSMFAFDTGWMVLKETLLVLEDVRFSCQRNKFYVCYQDITLSLLSYVLNNYYVLHLIEKRTE